jgi:integrase
VPTDLAALMQALADVRDEAAETPLVDRSPRTVRRCERLYADTGDGGWIFLGPHDLRRTWGTLPVEREVEPGLVMEWSG